MDSAIAVLVLEEEAKLCFKLLWNDLISQKKS